MRIGIGLRPLTEFLGVFQGKFMQLKDRSDARQRIAVRIGQVEPEELATSTQFP